MPLSTTQIVCVAGASVAARGRLMAAMPHCQRTSGSVPAGPWGEPMARIWAESQPLESQPLESHCDESHWEESHCDESHWLLSHCEESQPLESHWLESH